MKNIVSLFALGAFSCAALPAVAGEIDPSLQSVLDTTPAEGVVSTLVFLRSRVDLGEIDDHMDRILADRWLRHKIVVEALLANARNTQGDLEEYLGAELIAGTVASYEAMWISNVFRVDAEPAEIVEIAQRDDVEMVFYNAEIELIGPVEPDEFAVVPDGSASASMDPTPGIKIIQADRVWNELGITGEGTLISHLDTGVDGNHPALKKRWRGLDERYKDNPEWAWRDTVTNTKFPRAFSSHGTHTMGTLCGGEPGEEVGVAPGAQWIAGGDLDRISIPRTVADAITTFQWMVDPDKDPDTVWDVPDVSSHSWGLVTGHGYAPCHELFWEFIDALEAVDCVVVFAAGNEGFSQMRRPGDRASTEYDTFAVAACDGNNENCPIAGFSSRGPTNCTPNGQPAIKPEIAAPGVNVRSSVPGNGYSNFSGTSMATPHIGGVVALMREANPDVSNEEIKQAIYDTATDKGAEGNDNNYGWGLVNAYEAVLQVMNSKKPAACCFGNGKCKDMRSQKCRSKGGRTKFNEECGSFDCPQPGACCIDNSTCDVMLERDCIAQGGDFKGEGEKCKLACPCDLVKRFKAGCGKSGTIKAQVKFKDKRRDGETITFRVGERTKFEVKIRGKKARLFTCCYDGDIEVALIDPEGCVDPIIVSCK